MRLFRFNATTAFLLPPLQEGPCQTKSGFNATTAFLLLRVVEGRFLDPQTFQCHHGVPASRAMGRLGPWDRSGFNATTAFLLQSLPDNPHSVSSCFNATTAFLLPPSAPAEPAGRSSVSMPPRRSCFRVYPLPSPRAVSRFNATTAFLLPGGSRKNGGLIADVSMPPRRSCFGMCMNLCTCWITFQCHHGVPASQAAP